MLVCGIKKISNSPPMMQVAREGGASSRQAPYAIVTAPQLQQSLRLAMSL